MKNFFVFFMLCLCFLTRDRLLGEALQNFSERCQAIKFYQEGFWAQAMQSISVAVEKEPSDPWNYYWRAKIRCDREGQMKDLNRSIELDSSFCEALVLRGDLFFAMNQDENALKDYDCVLEWRPFASAFLGKGLILCRQKKWEEALLNFSLVLDLEPENFLALEKRAFCFMKMGQNTEGIADYKRYLFRKEGTKQMWTFLGCLYFREKNYESALISWERAKHFDPQDRKIKHNIGLSLSHLGDLDSAERLFKDLIQCDCTDAHARNHLGNLFFRKKKFLKAIENYSQAITLGLSSKGVYYNRARAYKNYGDYDNAISDFQSVLQKDASFLKAQFFLAELYYEQKKWKKAIKHFECFFEKSDSREKNDIVGRLFWANSWINLGEPSRAVLVLSELILLEPDIKEAYFKRALCYTKMGLYDDAIKNYKMVLTLTPKDSACFYNLGNLFCRKKQFKTAIVFFNQASKITPLWKDIYYNRSVAKKAIGDISGANHDLKLSLC